MNSPTWTWQDGPVDPGDCVVVDIDGVVADARHRQHFLEGRRKRWGPFFDAAGGDGLIEEVGALLEVVAGDVVVVLLTARPESIHGLTVDWLRRHDVRWDLLIMRGFGDYRPSPDVKRSELHALRRAGFRPLLAVDDDPRNVNMFRAEGVPCLEIPSGYHTGDASSTA
ncbi:MAG: hypothetical protein AAGD18_06145 [Actinomycetota bacterium]